MMNRRSFVRGLTLGALAAPLAAETQQAGRHPALLGARAARVAETAAQFDLVVRGGRVIDPESGLDGVRDIGIRDGRIANYGASASWALARLAAVKDMTPDKAPASGTGSILAFDIPASPPSGKLTACTVIDGKPKAPSGFAIGPDGDLYVAQRFDQRVRRFSANGKKKDMSEFLVHVPDRASGAERRRL
jgi:hypothetical protein